MFSAELWINFLTFCFLRDSYQSPAHSSHSRADSRADSRGAALQIRTKSLQVSSFRSIYKVRSQFSSVTFQIKFLFLLSVDITVLSGPTTNQCNAEAVEAQRGQRFFFQLILCTVTYTHI